MVELPGVLGAAGRARGAGVCRQHAGSGPPQTGASGRVSSEQV